MFFPLPGISPGIFCTRLHENRFQKQQNLLSKLQKDNKELLLNYVAQAVLVRARALKGKDLKDYDIHYMKGLGALNAKQSAEIYKNPHLYFYELDDFAEESMQHWFGKDSEMRKKKLV